MTAPNKETIGKAININPEKIIVYPSSFIENEEGQFLLCKIEGTKKIFAMGRGDFFSQLDGACLSATTKLCPLSHQNRLVLNKYLPYTLPSAFGRKTATFGLGDRLGLATPGHIRCFSNSKAKPIFAQQSKRELDLTGRNYEKVLDDVCFAVFQEGYRGGFGADGDHLKKLEDIEGALNCGYTMITLDCSDIIGRGIEGLTDEEAAAAYEKSPLDYRTRIERSYLSKGFLIGEEEYFFSKEELIRCSLIYKGAVDFVKEIYLKCLKKADHPVDFELSIDETESVTTVQGHLFVAMELEYNEVEVTSLAPRFIGEFQKGIDYIGNKDQFEVQLKQHAAIAAHFGYKLSIHSGSDKFSVFPIIGKYTGGILHLKTSGTSWLEAVGTIAEKNPLLYRKIHQKALEHFDEARRFYYVSGDPDKVEAPNHKEDEALIDYLKDDNSRQLLHITYGFVLDDIALKEELYQTLNENEEHYYGRLISHIGHHLDLINLTE
ncbi:MAG TPA: tagaturonate epimerase family protein [Anaerovoracaceae bacterium]|nr:tagaturonate epimerase family protein [Anaerovoracaceae bacterium]